MKTEDYLEILVNIIHSATFATIGKDHHPQTRIIDLMLYDKDGVYFLTAKGKEFYKQLMEQKYVAVSGTINKISISLKGKIKNIQQEKLDEIFKRNTYMQELYPHQTRQALEVFCIYEAQGEYFDITNPKHIQRDHFTIGQQPAITNHYTILPHCIGCKLCYRVCPQKCIDISQIPVQIQQNHCLHCGECARICPQKAIIKKENSYEPK